MSFKGTYLSQLAGVSLKARGRGKELVTLSKHVIEISSFSINNMIISKMDSILSHCQNVV